MRGILKKVAVAAVAVCSAVGLTFVGGGAAFAGEDFGTGTVLFCSTGNYASSGAPYIDCSVGSYWYLHHWRAVQTTPPRQVDVGSNIPCRYGGVSNDEGYTDLRWSPGSAPTARYKVTITACGGFKDIYTVDQDGDVTFVKGNFPGL
jgi:hypothetical protein